MGLSGHELHLSQSVQRKHGSLANFSISFTAFASSNQVSTGVIISTFPCFVISKIVFPSSPVICFAILAVRVGFEPTVTKNRHGSFQNFCTRPLCDLTLAEDTGVEPVNLLRGYGLANSCITVLPTYQALQL